MSRARDQTPLRFRITSQSAAEEVPVEQEERLKLTQQTAGSIQQTGSGGRGRSLTGSRMAITAVIAVALCQNPSTCEMQLSSPVRYQPKHTGKKQVSIILIPKIRSTMALDSPLLSPQFSSLFCSTLGICSRKMQD